MTSWTPPPARRWRRLRRSSPWLRRGLALACLALAALTAGRGTPAASTPESMPTLVTTHAVVAGTVLTAGDVALRPWPTAIRPAVALTAAAPALGRRVSGALAPGEAITSTRLVDPATWNVPAGLSAASISVSDENGGALLQAGDSIDLIAGSGADDALANRPSGGAESVVASGVTVLQVLPATSGAISSGHSTQIVVGVDRETAIRIAATLGAPMLATVHQRQ